MHIKRVAYVYPLSARADEGLYNPYLDNFMDSLIEYCSFINRQHPSRMGILQALIYAPRIDCIFFNWIEDLPDKKMGMFQGHLLPVLLGLLKLKKVKIVWILHNKISHRASHRYQKTAIVRNMAKYSDLIITHSSEGMDFLKQNNPQALRRAEFVHHPIIAHAVPCCPEKKYDILIWGTMQPYKGILNFVEYCAMNQRARSIRILLAGKFLNSDYYQEVLAKKTDNIEIVNRFINEEELRIFIAQSRHVVFPYNMQGVLSSGALMDSLGMGAMVIGPHAGAFGDLAKEGIIDGFKDYAEIIHIIERPHSGHDERLNRINEFIASNSWPLFGNKIASRLAGCH